MQKGNLKKQNEPSAESLEAMPESTTSGFVVCRVVVTA